MKYDVRQCLSFKYKGDETKHYFIEDNVIVIVEDCNNDFFEVKGRIVCFTEDMIILNVNGKLESYWYSYISFIDKI